MEESGDKNYKRIYKRNWKTKELEVYEIDRFGELYNLVVTKQNPVQMHPNKDGKNLILIILFAFFLLWALNKK